MTTNLVADGKPWVEKLIAAYKEGASDAEVAASFNIPIKEYHKQINDNKSLAHLVDLGRTLSLAFWEGLARKNVANKGFNSPLFAFYMKNRFGWADKTETVSTNENLNTNLDDLRNQVTREIAKFLKDATPEATDAQRVLASMIKEQANEG